MNFKTILGVCAIGVAAFASCKKSSSSNNASIVGSWKASQDAIDVNGNGILDANEKYADTSTDAITFNSNGTGTISIHSTPIGAFTWTLSSDNMLRTISIDTFGSTTTYDTGYSKVDQITSTTLIIRDTAAPITWTILTRQ